MFIYLNSATAIQQLAILYLFPTLLLIVLSDERSAHRTLTSLERGIVYVPLDDLGQDRVSTVSN